MLLTDSGNLVGFSGFSRNESMNVSVRRLASAISAFCIAFKLVVANLSALLDFLTGCTGGFCGKKRDLMSFSAS